MKKFILMGVMFFLCAASCAWANDYAKLVVFDARTNGPVTASTGQISVFLELNNVQEWLTLDGVYGNFAYIQLANDYSVNDIQNNPGTIHQIKAGVLNDNLGFNTFEGKKVYYLGNYSIVSNTKSPLVGGYVLNFNFYLGNGTLPASVIVPFYPNQTASAVQSSSQSLS